MIPLKSYYPEFVPNQILTNTQLNQLRVHLDQQDRRTRVRLTGTGIVCGLGWSIDGSSRIVLAEGYGVTSDGDLVEAAATTFTHALAYADPGVDEDGDLEYVPWQDGGGGQIELFELLDAAAVNAHDDETTVPQPLDAARLLGRVLVLYLERRPVDLRSCIVTDCNNTGTNIHLCVRALLVRREDLDALADCPPPPDLARLPRFHTATAPTELASAADVDTTWDELVNGALPGLVQGVQEAFDAHGTFLDLDVDIAPRLHTLVQFLHAAATVNDIHQSHHDVLADLACALNEAVTAACELRSECCPASTFPHHLMLGDLDGVDPFGVDPYRHVFRPAPASDVLYDGFERARRLFLRVAAMLDALDAPAFDRTVDVEVRLTPSRTDAEPLGRRAVPWYYALSPEIERHWQPRLCCTTEPLWSYHRPGALDTDAKGCTFLRIEGHLGLDRAVAVEAITDLRRQHNVPFEVLCARFGDPASESQPFHAKIEAFLEERATRFAELETAFFEAVLLDDPDIEKILELAANVAEVDEKIHQAVTDQAVADQERGWKLWCDATALVVDYRAARLEMCCLLRRLLGEIAKTETLFPGLPALPTALTAPDTLEVSDGALTIPGDLAKIQLADRQISELVAADGEARGEILARFTLPVKLQPWLLIPSAARAVRTSVDRLLRDLTEDPGHLSVELFMERVRAVWRDTLYYWMLWKVSDSSLPIEPPEPVIVGRWDDPSDWVLPVLDSCIPVRIVELAAAYEELRRRDLSWFTNLAEAVDGLEHRGGVEKCGTFVLVVDDTDVVIADFSLPCRPPCCCDIEPPTVCRPPLALPDHRAVVLTRLESGAFEPVDIEIDVLANDSDLNAPLDRDHLEVELDTDTTLLGGHVEQIEDGGVIRYTHESPLPGCVDRFTYTLRADGDPCSGEVTGDVLVFSVAEPKPEPGTVTGRVASSVDDAAIAGADVEITETGAVAATDAAGLYLFANVPEGVYHLRASHPDFLSATRTAAVPEGGTVAADFALVPTPRPGAITGRVASSVDDAGIAGADVEIAATGETTATNAAGGYLFADVPEGVYQLRASHPDFLSVTRTAAVHEGEPAATDFVLDPVEIETGSVVVTVRDAVTDTPIAGAQVELRSPVAGPVASGTADDQGVVEFLGVPVGGYAANANADGFSAGSVDVVIEADRRNQVGISLSPEQGTVVVLVRDVDGRTFSGVQVDLASEEQSAQHQALTDAGGEATFSNVSPGFYSALATLDGVFRGTSGQVGAGVTRMTVTFGTIFTEPNPTLVTQLETSEKLSIQDATVKIVDVYTGRQTTWVEATAALEPTIGTLGAYQGAVTFLDETLPDPSLSEAEIVAAGQETLKSLNAAIAEADDPEHQAALREAVVLVDAASLDRLTFSQSKELDPELEPTLRTLAELTRESGATTDQVLETWDGDRLTTELGVTSVDGVKALLGGTS